VIHVLHRHDLPTIHSSKSLAVCDACQHGKSHHLPFVSSSCVVKHPLEIVFSYVWGPSQTSVSGHNYYVSFINAYSRFTWLYLIKRKSYVFMFIQFQLHVERLLNHKILHVHSDWGANIATSALFSRNLGFPIMSPVHIHINRMVLLNVSTVTCICPVSFFGVMALPQPVF
jgi:histone deacetylase 1/2